MSILSTNIGGSITEEYMWANTSKAHVTLFMVIFVTNFCSMSSNAVTLAVIESHLLTIFTIVGMFVIPHYCTGRTSTD